MADLVLAPSPVLTRPRAARRDPGQAPGVRIEVRTPAIVSLAARRGRLPSLRDAVRARWDVALPEKPVFVDTPAGRLSWAGPGQWLLVAEGQNDMLDREVSALFPGAVSVTAQGDGRFVARISGPRAREALMKGIPVDLHDRAFPVGTTALTVAAHVNMQLWRLGGEVWEAAVFRGYADSFADWLLESAAEFGVEVG